MRLLPYFLLMLLAQQVIYSLNRIEGAQWYLNKDGAPVAHSTVPQTWQLQSLQLLAALALE